MNTTHKLTDHDSVNIPVDVLDGRDEFLPLPHSMVWANMHVGDHVYRFAIFRSSLTPVAPPEPPVGSVVLDDKGRAWQRCDPVDATPWFCTYNVNDAHWSGLQKHGPLTLLVPHPDGAR